MQKAYPRVQELYVGHPDGSVFHSDHGEVVKVLLAVAETWVHPVKAHYAHHVYVAVETLRWGKKSVKEYVKDGNRLCYDITKLFEFKSVSLAKCRPYSRASCLSPL